MRIEVISCWYREEFLAPLFFLNSAWAGHVTILQDKSKTQTGDLCHFDDFEKTVWINAAVARSKTNWVIVVDADESVFPIAGHADLEFCSATSRAALEQETADVVVVETKAVSTMSNVTSPIMRTPHRQSEVIHYPDMSPRYNGTRLDNSDNGSVAAAL